MKRHVNRALLFGATICCAAVALLGFGAAASAQTSTSSVDVQQRCLSDRGRIDVVVVAPADGARHSVSVTVGNLAPRTDNVASSTPARFTVTGRPDGRLKVETKVDGVVVDTRSVTVKCAPVLTEPVAVTSCLGGRGRVDVSLPAGADYTVSFPGLPARVVKAGSSGRTTWTGRSNGTYTITAVRSDNVKYGLGVSVECGSKGIPGTGLRAERSCTALADTLRSRALEKMTAIDFVRNYYEYPDEPKAKYATPRSMATDAVDQALPESRPNDADIAKFTNDGIFTASLGRYDKRSNPLAHPNSVAVLTTPDGVMIFDQRPHDVVVTLYDKAGSSLHATLRVEGAFVRARLVDGVVQLVTQSSPQLTSIDYAGISATKTGHWIPQYTWTKGSSTESQNLTDCAQVYIPDDFAGFSVVALTSLDAATLRPNPGIGVVADEATVLLEGDQAVIATRPWDPGRFEATLKPGVPLNEAYITSLHDFDLTDPQRATYRASGRVRGELHALDLLSDGRIATMSCEGASWWKGAEDGGCYINTLNTIGDSVRMTGAFGNFGRRRDDVEVRFGGDLAVVGKNQAVSMLVDLSVPGSFANGTLKGTTRPLSWNLRWNAIRLSSDRLFLIDGNQLALVDISNIEAPRRLSAYGRRDPATPPSDLYWSRTYFGDSFSWDPVQGRFALAFLRTSQNDPYHPGGYSYDAVGLFSIRDDKISLLADDLSGRTFEQRLWWRTDIEGTEVRIAKPGWIPSFLRWAEGS